MQKGVVRKRRPAQLTEYGKQLREKQELKQQYRLRERQFFNYIKEILEAGKKGLGNSPELLIRKLEKRLDNAVFRMGLANSRAQARQMVSHGHFQVNGRSVDIPSYQLSAGDVISVHASSKETTLFRNLQLGLKNYEAPSWLALDKENVTGTVKGEPTLEEVAPNVQLSLIFEFYSR